MSEKHQRTVRVDSVGDDGVFSMILATEGEASDGDILSIEGGQIPERMPLLLSHWNDPTAKAGSVTDPEKLLKAKPPALRTKGHIEMGGVGALADVRRDVAYMINRHGGAVSIRWDQVSGKPPVRRVNLPSDHPYFVDSEKATGPERWGYFWPEWKALEGSIVALGADPQALIGRAEETEGEVSTFWRAMASDLQTNQTTDTGITRTTTGELPAVVPSPFWIEPTLELEPREEPTPEAQQAAGLAALREAAHVCSELSIPQSEILEAAGFGEIINIPAERGSIEDETEEDLLGQIATLEERIDVLESPAEDEGRVEDDAPPASPERVEADPLAAQEPEQEAPSHRASPLAFDARDIVPGLDGETLGRFLRGLLDEHEQRLQLKVQAIFDKRLGRVSQ